MQTRTQSEDDVLLSVIICTLEPNPFFERCVRTARESIDANPAPSEIIVVDNSSSPSTHTTELAATFGCRYYWEPRRGVSCARNRGILQAQGTMLAFLDDNIIVRRKWASQILRPFDDPSVWAVTGPVSAADSEPDALRWHSIYGSSPTRRTVFDSSTPLPFFPVTAGLCGFAANMAFRSDFFFRHGLFDPLLGTGTWAAGNEDVDRFFVCLSAGGKIVFEPGAQVSHQFGHGRMRLWRRFVGYAAGQAAYLFKCCLRGKQARTLALSFVRDRLAAAFFPQKLARRSARPLKAPRLALALGSVLGVTAYCLASAGEFLWPRRRALLPQFNVAGPKPRILIVLHNSQLTGVEKVNQILVARLCAKPCSLCVVLPGPGSAAAAVRALGVDTAIVPFRRLRISSLPRELLAYVLSLPGGVAALYRAIKRFSPDVIHVHTLVNPTPLIAGKMAGKRTLLHLHEIIDDGPRILLSRIVNRLADQVVAVSHAAARSFSHSCGQREVTVIHNGVPLQAPSAYRRRQQLLFAGRLSDDKGAHLFIQVAERLNVEFPELSFVLCGLTVPGRQRYEAKLWRLLDESAVDRSRFQIKRDEDDIRAPIRESTILLSCSTAPDPFPVAVLEAMSADVIVVVPDCGGLPEMVAHGENGLIYRMGSVDEAVECIRRLLVNPLLCQRLRAGARQTIAARLSDARMAEQVFAQYLGMPVSSTDRLPT